MNDNEEFNAVKNFLTLHIGVESSMGISVQGGHLMAREGVLRLVEGESVDIKCYANHGYPPANFLWLAPIRNNRSSSDIQG